MHTIFVDSEGKKTETYITNPSSLIGRMSTAVKNGVYEHEECGTGSDAIAEYNYTHAIFVEFIDVKSIKSPHAKKLYRMNLTEQEEWDEKQKLEKALEEEHHAEIM